MLIVCIPKGAPMSNPRRALLLVGFWLLAWGEVSQVRDSVVVRAYLYDVRRPGEPPRERTVRLGGDLAGAGPLFESLAD